MDELCPETRTGYCGDGRCVECPNGQDCAHATEDVLAADVMFYGAPGE